MRSFNSNYPLHLLYTEILYFTSLNSKSKEILNLFHLNRKITFDVVVHHSGGGHVHIFYHLPDYKIFSYNIQSEELIISHKSYSSISNYIDTDFGFEINEPNYIKRSKHGEYNKLKMFIQKELKKYELNKINYHA